MSKPRNGSDEDQPVVPPPATFTVDHDPKPVLYLPDGRVMAKRPIGFRA